MVHRKEKKPLTLQQKKTYGYLRTIVGIYLMYTSYSMFRDMKIGIETDRPLLVTSMAVLFAIAGLLFAITGFSKAYQISREEINDFQKEKEDVGNS